jgi:uncharacterized protein (DUF885 family)
MHYCSREKEIVRMRLMLVLVLVLAVACASAGPSPAERVTALADRYVREYLEAFPQYALAIGAPEAHPDRLADHSLPALARWEAREDEMAAELASIDAGALEGTPEAITRIFLENLLASAKAYRACRMELWNVSPTWTGWQGEMPLVAGMQAVATAGDQRHALARWSHLPQYLDDEIANLGEGLRLGYTAPKNNVRAVIEQMDAMLAAPIADSPWVKMAPSGAAEFRASLEELERSRIKPAIQRYRDFLADTYLSQAREPIGVSANPDGEGCYRAAVRYFATVELTPQEVHDLGLAQMDRIMTEVRAIGERSFGTSDPLQVMALARTERKYRFTDRAELIAYAESAVERARQALPKAFGRIPSAPVIVEPYPPFLEKSAPGQAIPPSADGKPGKYMINAYEASEQSRAGQESTAFHETYPGHHMQMAVALEQQGLHPISRYFFLSGFGEGWALYAERLSDEMGLFSSDVDRLGLLSNEALRAARLVVDSGMHVLGWSRQQSIDYLLAHTTSTAASATAETDRYVAVPGQATAYMIGSLEIRRLRSEAEQALGERFDLRAFHDLVLEDGAMPLWALREKVERWIAAGR